MQVEDIYAFCSQLCQALVEALFELVRCVQAWCVRVCFRGYGETAFVPVRLACPGFLFAADVIACGVNFVVAAGLEGVEDAVVGLEGGDAGAFGLVGS